MAIILNATAGLFDKQQAINLCRWGWLAICLHATYLLLSSDKGKVLAQRFRALFGRRVVLSYIVVAILSSAVGVLYWYGINAAFRQLGWKRESEAKAAELKQQADSVRPDGASGKPTDLPIPESGAIVVVGKLQITQPQNNQPFEIKIFLRNRGNLPATINHGQAYKLTDVPLSREEENTGFAVAAAMMKPPESANMTEMPPGEENRFFTSPNEFLKTDDVNSIIAGKKRLYLMVLIHFHDASMPAGTIGVTEWCGYFSGSFSAYYACNRPIRTFLRLNATVSATDQGPKAEAIVPNSSTNSPALFLSCRGQSLPLMIPAGKSIRIMRLYTRATALDINTLMEASGPPDQNGIYPPPPIIQRHNAGSPYDLQVAGICDISNRGDVMLRDILFPVRIEFFREHDIRYKEVEPDPRTLRFGPPKGPPAHVIERMVSINPLAVGDTFTFCVVNACSQYVARVSIADNAQVSVIGESSRRMIRLERSTQGVLAQFVLPVSSFPWTDVEPCT